MIRLLSLLALLAMSKFGSAQDWVQLSSPNGNGRHHPITVANDQYAYVLAGQAGFAALNLADVHRYDAASDTWEELDAFPGGGRGYGYGVCEGDDAYVGFGSNDNGYPTDFWHLDMVTGAWTEMASFPGDGRNHPAMVLTGGQVFVGLGSNDNGNLGDWWGYDIASDSWEELAPFTAGDRHHPFYFGIDGIAYVGMGHGDSQNGALTIYGDFHAYDPATDTWTQLDDFPGEARVAGTQFAADGKGYVLSGDGDNHGPLDDGEFWEYNPAADAWTELEPHPGGARWAPGSFVLGCHAYLTGGLEGATDTFHHDLWRFSLSADCGCTDPEAVNFSPEAVTDDGTCCYVAGCMVETAVNYDPAACQSDGSCIAPILGCTDETSEYYDAQANTDMALGGPISTAELGGGGFHYNDSWDMLFSVSEPTVLTSVDVQADVAFTIDVYVRDAGGATLFQEPFTLSVGWNTLPIGVEIPNGTDFAMGIEGDNQGLFRNNAVPAGAFPIAVADRMSITGNTTDSPLDYHYYFYRWVVESPCAPLASVGEWAEDEFRIAPNPISDHFQWSGPQVVSMTWLDMAGREVSRSGEVLANRMPRPDLNAGQYIVVAHTDKGIRRVLVQLD